MKKKFTAAALFIFIGAYFFAQSPAAAKTHAPVFQVSTIQALLGGILDGGTEYASVAKKGDFGIGTFNHLDGEMIALDGHFYQVRADGHVYPADPSAKTPFVTVTRFEKDSEFPVSGSPDFKSLLAQIDAKLPTKNIIYAVRAEGEWEYVKTRSVPAQKKPYPKLEQIVKTQPVFEFHKVRGTLVGFRFPEYMSGLNVPGYHFHFLTEDKKAGGHVLDLKVSSVTVSLEECSGLELLFPGDKEFYQADLSGKDKTALIKVEK